MTYLFDTDILSHLMKRSPPLPLVRRFASVPAREQATSSITLGELYYGARRLGAAGEALALRIQETLARSLVVLPFDAPAAVRYGALRAELEAAGTPIGDADTRIAAIALEHGLVLVSGNLRHFRRVPGLAVEDWLPG